MSNNRKPRTERFVFAFTYPDEKRPASGYVGGFRPNTDIAFLCKKLFDKAGTWYKIEELRRMTTAVLESRLHAISKHGRYHASQPWVLEYSRDRKEVRMIFPGSQPQVAPQGVPEWTGDRHGLIFVVDLPTPEAIPKLISEIRRLVYSCKGRMVLYTAADWTGEPISSTNAENTQP